MSDHGPVALPPSSPPRTYRGRGVPTDCYLSGSTPGAPIAWQGEGAREVARAATERLGGAESRAEAFVEF